MSFIGIGGIDCEECGSFRTKVTNSRPIIGGVRRRRKCVSCGHTFTTHEYNESEVPESEGLFRIAERLERKTRSIRDLCDQLDKVANEIKRKVSH